MTLRILHVTSTPTGIGGIERLLLSMAGRYDENRFSVSYTNLFGLGASKDDFETQLRTSGVRYHEVAGRGWLDVPRIIWRLAATLRSERIAIVQPHMPHANIIVAAAARMAGVPVILSTRHYYVDEKEQGARGRRIRALDVRCARAATFTVAVSEAVRRSLTAAGIPASRTSVIPNGVDVPIVGEIDRGRTQGGENAPRDRLLIGCVGGLYAYKGIGDLLRAAAVVRVRREITVLIVGDGPERAALEALARDLGIGDHVTFAGFRGDAARLVQQVDIYVQPSRFESFGIAILEAMAVGRPVVATSVGGIPEIVRHGQTGLLVECGDVPALARAIETLVDDAATRLAMGAAGRQRVAEHFTIDRTVRQYEELYERLVANSGGAIDRPANSPS